MCGDHYLDQLGHGTAVAGAIREKAPQAELFAVKIFAQKLTTDLDTLLRALEWCVTQKMDLVNLSLGATNEAHREALAAAIQPGGPLVISAAGQLPGLLDSVIPVEVDWDCPRDEFRVHQRNGRTVFAASGYARPIPGVPPEHNLKGISFAVANFTGILARIAGEPANLQAALKTASLKPDT